MTNLGQPGANISTGLQGFVLRRLNLWHLQHGNGKDHQHHQSGQENFGRKRPGMKHEHDGLDSLDIDNVWVKSYLGCRGGAAPNCD